jgi:hypothetical protein
MWNMRFAPAAGDGARGGRGGRGDDPQAAARGGAGQRGGGAAAGGARGGGGQRGGGQRGGGQRGGGRRGGGPGGGGGVAAEPGSYRVKLTVNGRTHVSTLIVRPDPDVERLR